MIRFFSSHPTAANLLMMIFILSGLFSVPKLNRETFPTFTSSKVQVQISYPGASTEDVEEGIIQRLEDALNGIQNVKETTAQAREGVGTFTLEMNEETGNLQEFLDDIRTEVDAIRSFPQEAEEPVITNLSRSSDVVVIAVTGSMSVFDLKDYTETLKRRLQRLPKISLVNVDGFSDRQIRIQVASDTLLTYGLNIQELAEQIDRQSINRPTGTIKSPEKDFLLRFKDEKRTLQEFRDIIILGGTKGGEIRLGDIATVKEYFEDEEKKTLFNNKRAGIINVSKTEADDALEVLAVVKEFLIAEQSKAPPGIELSITRDLASIIQDRLELLWKNGWQGLLLVFFSLWLFFSFRLAFWVTMGLPISFAGALFVMLQIGYTFNMMTTLALVITLGLLMDDAIVIAENIASHLQRGKSSLDAAVDGIMEVQNGVISSFLTTACVFVPLAFLDGQIGRVLKVIPVVLLIVLAISLIEAFFILPNHLAHSLKAHKMSTPGRLRSFLNNGIAWFREKVLGRIVDTSIHFRYLTLGLVIMVFIISLGTIGSGMLKFKAFPDLEDDSLEAKIYLPPGTTFAKTEKTVSQVLQGLEKMNQLYTPLQPEQESLIQKVRVSFSTNSDVSESGAHLATIFVDMLKAEKRVGNVNELLSSWRKETGKVTDVISLKFDKPQRGPAGNAIEVELRGENLGELKLLAEDLADWFYQFDGIYDLDHNLRPGKPEIQMSLKKGASILGMNSTTIANQIRTAFQGTTISEIQVGIKSFEVDIRLDSQDKNSLADLDSFKIMGAGGEKIPLLSVTELKYDRGYSSINRVDGLRTVTLSGSINSQVANTKDIMDRLKKSYVPKIKDQYPDVEIFIKGESSRTQETGSSMLEALFAGLIGVFVLLSFQFRSYAEPLIIMLAIPLSLIGVIWGHIFMEIPISMPSILGFISLSGIVVNDSILLVEFIKLRRKENMPINEAASQASRERFRAVLLTSLTTVIGLFPLLAEQSLQAQILIPIATSITFGLMSSTVLVLVIVPSFYTILGDWGWVEEL